jgi:inner membrane protein
MPSPVGHALGAMTIGWIAAGVPDRRRVLIQRACWLAAVGLAPDLDLLIGRHSAETHSAGAALLAGSIASLMRWPVADGRVRIWCAVTLAWLSHPILDSFGQDNTAPYGVMLLWPFSYEHILSSVNIFDPISRRWWLPGFVVHTLKAVVREVVILGPIAWLSWWLMRPTRARDSDAPRQ